MLKDKPFYNKTYEIALEHVFYANLNYLNAALDEVKKKYGSIEEYLVKGLEVDIDKLRRYYLED